MKFAVGSEALVTDKEESNSCTFYRPNSHAFAEDGTLVMDVSWWEDNSHFVGVLNCAVDHPDYDLWRWILQESGCTESIISNTLLESLRLDYEETDFFKGTAQLRDLNDIPGIVRAVAVDITPTEVDTRSYDFELIMQLPDFLLDVDDAADAYQRYKRLQHEVWEQLPQLSRDAGSLCRVYGSVEGGDVIEYFIGTDDPQTTFEICKPFLEAAKQLDRVTAAYLRNGDDNSVVIWPTHHAGEFRPQHQRP